MNHPDGSADPVALRELIVDQARALGFHRVGVAAVGPARRYQAYRDWLDADRHGEMGYMAAPAHVEARRDPRALLAQARSVVVVAMAYTHDGGVPDPAGEVDAAAPSRGVVARYARGQDYHGVLKSKLWALADTLGQRLGREVGARPCVDSAPVLERDLAEVAGLGFMGKNTMLITPGLGSYTVLGELLLDVEVAPTPSPAGAARVRCGDCRACLDACPTEALPAPWVLDARRCVSYLTIEHPGPIAPELRPGLGRMVFGCDLCQEACPFNARAPARHRPDPALDARSPDSGAPDLLGLLGLGANQRRRYLHDTALRRAGRAQLLRNVCVALGNTGDDRAVPALTRALADRSPLVRAHAAWALGQLGAGEALRAALVGEAEAEVRAEIEAALATIDAAPATRRARAGAPAPGPRPRRRDPDR
ncbi:tRNA epoxyqueuosine(34) reductase QueG [Haliangium sp.]|uniref:tRNA epoxyqueuosine(34) reductase QueG n=1 Tax=Haliangium sp. TaxID=2663208 RepID=UPI003D1469C0